eukprot:2836047-Amphidinium_carterae.3
MRKRSRKVGKEAHQFKPLPPNLRSSARFIRKQPGIVYSKNDGRDEVEVDEVTVSKFTSSPGKGLKC